MPYGIVCPRCGATVDNNEYHYIKDMCEDCIADEENRERSNEKTIRMLNGSYEQMKLEV